MFLIKNPENESFYLEKICNKPLKIKPGQL